MPIQFYCPSCNKLLQTPDDSAGRQAKCPECGQIVEIPSESTPPAPPEPTEPPGPFAETVPAGPGPETAAKMDPSNPYASPTASYADFPSYEAGTQGDLTPTIISFDQILSRTWQRFSAELGTCVLFGLIAIGIVIAGQIINQVLGVVQQVAWQERQIALGIILVVASQLVAQLVQAFVECLSIRFGLNLVRGSASPLSGIFDIGRYYLPVLGFNLLMLLIMIAIVVPCAAPFGIGAAIGDEDVMVATGLVSAVLCLAALVFWIVLYYMFMLAPYFIIDRNEGVIDAMKTSAHFMRGNKGIAFLLLLVVGIIGGLFVLITCCIGALFLTPYMAVLSATLYVSATGQWMRLEGKAFGGAAG